MKLTKEMKTMLLSWGEREEDLPQIEESTSKTIYTLVEESSSDFKCDKETHIGIRKAIKLLGLETFLSGISRSAFHWTAVRQINSKSYIYFDSSKLFKQ